MFCAIVRLKRINAAPLHQTIYMCACVYHANKLPAPGVAICAAFTSNDPSRARICGEKNAMRRRTDDT